MSKKLNGKVAIVTGSSKGIGAGIAEELANEGASVVVNYTSSKTDADKVVEKIKSKGGQAIAVQANIAKKKDVERLFSETLKAFKKVDILVNNAGVYEFTSLEEFTEESFRKMYDINVLGLLLASQESLKHFGNKGCSIINIGSVAGVAGAPNSSLYSGTKGAVDAITRTLSKELGARQIRVNAVNPGLVETEGTHTGGFLGSDFESEAIKLTPLGRIGRPKDIGPAVAFLASDDASWISGETLYITGGYR